MTWTAYRVTFRLLSPIHSGWRKVGNLQQTRPYVTGRSLWGALTARLTREHGSSDYHGIGKQIDKQLAFTYFYPSITTNPDKVELWPWPDKQWDRFAWTFLGSYVSTALENGRSAEEGSLHETEFIAPYIRNYLSDNEPEPVYLVGYIFEKDIPASDEQDVDKQKVVSNWKKVLDKLQCGGERSYGWGKLHLEGEAEKVKDGKCFDYTLLDTKDRPQLMATDNNRHLLAHTQIDSVERGVAIEPLLGRETSSNTSFGKSFSNPEICWVPGGKVNAGETFQILEKGVWKQLP